jgi:hypothetical protein
LKKLTITTGAQDFVITPAEENSTFFAALPALTEQAVSCVAKGSNSHTYYAANPEFRDLTLAPIRIKFHPLIPHYSPSCLLFTCFLR